MDALNLIATTADVSFRNPRDFRFGAANHLSTTISTMRMVNTHFSEATDNHRSGSRQCFLRHRVMRRFSFRSRILFKHTDLTPQWCEVRKPLHGKNHAVWGQPLFGVRPALKAPIGALKSRHWPTKNGHWPTKSGHWRAKKCPLAY